MKRDVVGLSGGVDSSIAAYLLKKEGHEVTALFMKNWHDPEGTISGDCPWHDDLLFAKLVAKKLDIPFHTTDLSKQYRTQVVDYMFSEYRKGRTPNPDVLCNREIKFSLFIEEALKLNADYVATGHYCGKKEIHKGDKTIYRLIAGRDRKKDQSYFLCQLGQDQLKRAIFPLAEISKEEVRETATRLGLATAGRKDSQGICFVGKVDLPSFLQQKLEPAKGDIIEIPRSHYKNCTTVKQGTPPEDYPGKVASPCRYTPGDGKRIGTHNGAWFYTVGQRKGLNVGGKKEPLFVIGTDTEQNIIYTGEGHSHPGLNRKGLFIRKEDVHWIREDLKLKEGESGEYLVRIRYRQPLQEATLYMRDNGLYIIFSKLQRGITPGQFAAWYRKEELLGSGVID